jgi:uncharacterized membrane protein
MINFLKDILANKTRIIAVISLVLLIAQSHGLDLTNYIGADWQTTLTNVFALITLIAIGDNGTKEVTNNEVVQETPQSENNTTIEPETLEEFHGAKKEQLQSLVHQINTIINE